MINEKEFKERCAEILRKNITFSHQVGNYVIHGALDELWELHTEQNSHKHSVSGKRPSLQEVKDNIANIQGFDSWETCFNQHILQAAVPELMDLLAIHYQAACAESAKDTVAKRGACEHECTGPWDCQCQDVLKEYYSGAGKSSEEQL